MSKRRPVRPSKDKKIFSATAKGTKTINLGAYNARGGLRL